MTVVLNALENVVACCCCLLAVLFLFEYPEPSLSAYTQAIELLIFSTSAEVKTPWYYKGQMKDGLPRVVIED